MNSLVVLTLGAAAGLLLLESGMRLHRLRLAPLRLRWLYASFLLNDEAVQAVMEIHQRVERAGVRSFDELFGLYASASGQSKDAIESLFGFRLPWRALLNARLVLRNHLQWHVGLVPLPNQRLRTASITASGARSTGSPAGRFPASLPAKRVILTGGSVAYGYGATSDAATIAGRMEYYLNEKDRRGTHRWEVVNCGFPAATSFQELIGLLQTAGPPAAGQYLVSFSGCNDVDQQFGHAQPNVSALAQGYSNALQRRGPWGQAMRALGRRLVLLAVLRRFLEGYRQWPGAGNTNEKRQAAGGRSFHADVDQPDIYPLW
nr:hypothetical protein [Nitrospirota bacterium]